MARPVYRGTRGVYRPAGRKPAWYGISTAGSNVTVVLGDRTYEDGTYGEGVYGGGGGELVARGRVNAPTVSISVTAVPAVATGRVTAPTPVVTPIAVVAAARGRVDTAAVTTARVVLTPALTATARVDEATPAVDVEAPPAIATGPEVFHEVEVAVTGVSCIAAARIDTPSVGGGKTILGPSLTAVARVGDATPGVLIQAEQPCIATGRIDEATVAIATVVIVTDPCLAAARIDVAVPEILVETSALTASSRVDPPGVFTIVAIVAPSGIAHGRVDPPTLSFQTMVLAPALTAAARADATLPTILVEAARAFAVARAGPHSVNTAPFTAGNVTIIDLDTGANVSITDPSSEASVVVVDVVS